MKGQEDKVIRWYGTFTDIHELVVARMKARKQREQMTKAMDVARINVSERSDLHHMP